MDIHAVSYEAHDVTKFLDQSPPLGATKGPDGVLRREVAAQAATPREIEALRRTVDKRTANAAHRLDPAQSWLETALHGARVYVSSQDRNLRYLAISKPMFGLRAEQIIGRTDEEILPAEDRGPMVVLKRAVIAENHAQDAEIRMTEGGTQRWYDFHVEPLHDHKGEVVGVSSAAVDITSRKEGEVHLRLLMRELTHRSKNLLAVIQAMARRTARHAGSIDTFLERFSARLQSMARAHDLLVQESWYGASLHELIRSQLGHHLDRQSQVSLEGPNVLLKPEAAQSLGLALHELLTNAAKYGSLSAPGGRLAIRSRRLSPEEGGGMELLWTESAGPKVAPPQYRGFGSLVIEQNLKRAADADVQLQFCPAGLNCRIVVPFSQLASAERLSALAR